MRPELRMVLQGGTTTAVTFGIARFSIGLFLEPVRAAFDLSYTVAGALASVNLVTYVVGVAIAPALGRRFGYAALVRPALLLCALGLGVSAVTPGVGVLVAALGAIGIGCATGWMAIAAVTTAAVDPARRGIVVGAITGATGIGMIAASLTALVTLDGDVVGWRAAWGIQAALALIAALAVRPTRTAAADAVRPAVRPRRVRGLLPYYVGYGSFATAYTLFATFIVAAVAGSVGDFRAGLGTWSLVGLGSLPGALLLGRWSDAVGRSRALVATQLVGAAACALVLVDLGTGVALAPAAAVVLGGIMSGTGGLMPALLADVLPTDDVPGAFASVTLVFALVQAVAPTAGGALIDATGGFASVYVAAALAFGVSALAYGARTGRAGRPLPQDGAAA